MYDPWNPTKYEENWNTQDEFELIKKTKQKTIKIIIVSLVLIILPLVLLVSWFFKLISPSCVNEVLRQEKQPNGINKSVVFIRDCGATIRESYNVSIIRTWSNIDTSDPGNIFSAYSLGEVEWLSKSELQIIYGGGQTFKREEQYKGIKIRYK